MTIRELKAAMRASLAVLFLACLGFSNATLAGSKTFAGAVTTSDTALTDCVTNYARIIPFHVTATGTYTLDNNAPPAVFNGPTFSYVAIFTVVPTYVSVHPNRLGIVNNAGGSSAAIALTAGTTYYVVAGGSAGCGTVYPVSYDATLSGPGEIIVATPEPLVSVPVPTLAEGLLALLALTLALWGGIAARLRGLPAGIRR